MLQKKSRYKPLYKKFVRLRKNVQNRRKLVVGNFKKQKWKNLITFLKTSIKRRKNNFRSYDQFSFFISKYSFPYKKKYLNKLLIKQRFRLFYGDISNKKLKKLLQTVNSSKQKKISASNLIINYLENRLDSILYRAHFVKSIREARLIIQHGHVFINNVCNKNNAFLLTEGDVISISSNYSKQMKTNLFSSNLWPLPPEYLQINYKTFQISILNTFDKPSIFLAFPFFLDLPNIINYR